MVTENSIMKIKSSALLILFCFQTVYANDSSDTNQALIGGISMKKNNALAQQEKQPSAWLLANSCAACHGTNGAEFNDIIPPLAGMDKDKFIKEMTKFKTQPAEDFVAMGIIAQPMTDSEIKAMAEFFSQQKPIEWTKADWNKDVENK